MQKQEVGIIIDKKTGEITMETFGYKGKTCEEILDKIEQGAGLETIKKENKNEKYDYVAEKQQDRINTR